MRIPNLDMHSTAIAALISLPLASGIAFAQQAQDAGQTGQSATQSQDTTQQPSTPSAGEAGDQQTDTVLATVGDAEIRGSDVMTIVGMLPPQLQSQPPQMLVPLALEQLILRELILEEARGQNLVDDPEVVALVQSSTQTAADDAMVQVWIDRELADVVTDEAVQQVYDQAQSQGTQNLPSLEGVRPQIEQHLRQQAMQELRTRLREGADIVLYDPTGRPIEQDGGTSGTTGQSGAGTAGTDSVGESGSGGTTGGGGQSGDGASGSSDSSEEEPQNN